MAFYGIPNPPACIPPEHLVLTTVSDDPVQGKFDVLESKDIQDVLIQNDTRNKGYVTWGISPVNATVNDTILAPEGSISLENVDFNHFSLIRIPGGEDVIAHITGVGH